MSLRATPVGDAETNVDDPGALLGDVVPASLLSQAR
jgi:hypothetical protein